MNLESGERKATSGGIGGFDALPRDSTYLSDMAPLVQCLKATYKW